MLAALTCTSPCPPQRLSAPRRSHPPRVFNAPARREGTPTMASAPAASAAAASVSTALPEGGRWPRARGFGGWAGAAPPTAPCACAPPWRRRHLERCLLCQLAGRAPARHPGGHWVARRGAPMPRVSAPPPQQPRVPPRPTPPRPPHHPFPMCCAGPACSYAGNLTMCRFGELAGALAREAGLSSFRFDHPCAIYFPCSRKTQSESKCGGGSLCAAHDAPRRLCRRGLDCVRAAGGAAARQPALGATLRPAPAASCHPLPCRCCSSGGPSEWATTLRRCRTRQMQWPTSGAWAAESAAS